MPLAALLRTAASCLDRRRAANIPPSPYTFLPDEVLVPTPVLRQLLAATEMSVHPEALTALAGARESGVMAAAGWPAPGTAR